MAEIVLSDGQVTLVDADIADEFGGLRWDPKTSSGHATYVVRRVYMLGRTYWFSLHRIIMDALPGVEVDHRDGNGLDNRRENLRIVTQSQNQMNRRAQHGTSRYKGVCRVASTGKWKAQIRFNGVRRCLGEFKCEVDAARAYDAGALDSFGQYARLNFPKDRT